jgi:hypothetical protein
MSEQSPNDSCTPTALTAFSATTDSAEIDVSTAFFICRSDLVVAAIASDI